MKKLLIFLIIGIILLFSSCNEQTDIEQPVVPDDIHIEEMPVDESDSELVPEQQPEAPPPTSPDITTTAPQATSTTITDTPATTTTATSQTTTTPQATTSTITTPKITTQATTTPPIIEKPSNSFILPHEFTATDLYGNTVTEKTLGEKQVFLVHFWATWCGPCVRGMPDMAKLAQDYGDDVGFIGLVVDFDSNADGAVKIIESAGMPNSFIMIDANEPSAKALLEIVSTGFVPSSALITKDGSSQLITGGKYAEALDAILG